MFGLLASEMNGHRQLRHHQPSPFHNNHAANFIPHTPFARNKRLSRNRSFIHRIFVIHRGICILPSPLFPIRLLPDFAANQEHSRRTTQSPF